jgi:hypothetical protein
MSQSEIYLDAGEAPAEPVRRRGNYFMRHWRGDNSLAWAYWINGVCLSVAVNLLAVLVNWAGESVDNLYLAGLPILLLGVLLLPFNLWQFVGTWRSASLHVSRGGKRAWAIAAYVMLTLGGIKTGMIYLDSTAPNMKALAMAMLAPEPERPYTLDIEGDGTELELAGGLARGTATAFIRALDEHPAVKIVHLNSTGGLVREGERISKEIRRRGLTTVTSVDCMSACTLAFLGGERRLLVRGGRVGFHSASIAGADKDDELNESFRAALGNVGASREFIHWATTTSSKDMWFPSIAELRREHVITAVVDSGRFPQAGVAAYKDERTLDHLLQGDELFAMLAQYDPQIYLAARTQLSEAANSGKNYAQITQTSALLVSDVLTPYYLGRAPTDELLRYWRIRLREASHLQVVHGAYCLGILGVSRNVPQAELQAQLPEALRQAEREALLTMVQAAVIHPQSAKDEAAATKLIEEVMVHLQQTAPKSYALLLESDKHADQPHALCAGWHDFYELLLEAPDQERVGSTLRYLLDS